MREAKQPKSARGFTLNELLVSMAILGILSGLLIANFSRGRLSDDLRISSQSLASNLRRVQNLAQIGQSLVTGVVPPGGYGIAFEWLPNQNTYSIFADIAYFDIICITSNPNNANMQYDGASCDQLAEAGVVQFRPDVVVSRIKLKGITCDFGGACPWDQYLDIAFKPPKPIPVVDGAVGLTLEIELRHLKNNQNRTITIIGPSGQISERAGGI